MLGPMQETHSGAAPRPVRAADVAALIGWLAVYEGELMIGQAPGSLTARFQDRLVQAGLLDVGSDERDLRQAINDLNHRLRYVLGEYPEPPGPRPVPD